MVSFKRSADAKPENTNGNGNGSIGKESISEMMSQLMSMVDSQPAVRLPVNHAQPAVHDNKSGEKIVFDATARETVLRMIESVPELEQPFVFYTQPRTGKAWIQAMRTTLARIRASCAAEGVALQYFHMFVIDIEKHMGYDKVTVVRSLHPSVKQRSAYSSIIALLSKQQSANADVTTTDEKDATDE